MRNSHNTMGRGVRCLCYLALATTTKEEGAPFAPHSILNSSFPFSPRSSLRFTPIPGSSIRRACAWGSPTSPATPGKLNGGSASAPSSSSSPSGGAVFVARGGGGGGGGGRRRGAASWQAETRHAAARRFFRSPKKRPGKEISATKVHQQTR